MFTFSLVKKTEKNQNQNHRHRTSIYIFNETVVELAHKRCILKYISIPRGTVMGLHDRIFF